jgi:hypothetical protein
MFDFKKKVLGPLVDNTTGQLDEALGIKNLADRIENLLSVKEEAKGSFGKLAHRLKVQRFSWAGLAALGWLVSWVGLAPLHVAGILIYAGAMAMEIASDLRCSAVFDSRGKLDKKIDGEVQQLTKANPQEAVKSPRFLRALLARFNLASASKTEINQLRLALTPTPSIQPRAELGL